MCVGLRIDDCLNHLLTNMPEHLKQMLIGMFLISFAAYLTCLKQGAFQDFGNSCLRLLEVQAATHVCVICLSVVCMCLQQGDRLVRHEAIAKNCQPCHWLLVEQ